jgi:two-component system sensor histidine kinase HydH
MAHSGRGPEGLRQTFLEHLAHLQQLYEHALHERCELSLQALIPLLDVFLNAYPYPARIVELATGRPCRTNPAARERADSGTWQSRPLPYPLEGFCLEWSVGVAPEEERALEMMSAVIAHRMRSVLTGIAGFASLIEQEAGDRLEVREGVRRIMEGTTRLERMVQDLLHFSQPLAPHWKPVALEGLVRDLVEAFRISHPEADIECMLEPVTRIADEALLRQAWIALVLNALEACDRRHIRVQIRLRPAPPELEVRNWGEVIEEERQEKIFWPFFTTKAQNLGLGLAIARRIARVHGAVLELVESDQKRGTAFCWRWIT